ncbi:MAG: chromate efflux transporter [Porticoccaceae bacterium]
MTKIETHSHHSHPWSIFVVFLRLGLTSFGGPVAHLGYFRDEFVTRRQWLSERSYGDLVALCQFLPGPASSQVGLALGLYRGGYAGAAAAWAGFTLPSALALIFFALGVTRFGDILPPGVLHGLKVVAVAVVAQAVWGMARNLCTNGLRITLMAIACCLVVLMPFPWVQVAVIGAAGVAGALLCTAQQDNGHEPLPIAVGRGVALLCLALFFTLLMTLPLLAKLAPNQVLALIDAFYRAGALIFGGGHVVLPLLQAEVVPSGWVSGSDFLAGYGAAQAIPGPLVTFAAFLGAAMKIEPSGWLGAAICLLAIYTPSFLLVVGALPFWEQIRHNLHIRAALAGINAAVVGLLLAALYQPLWTSAIVQPQDFALALAALIALMFWKLPPWLVVMAAAAGGWLLALVF